MTTPAVSGPTVEATRTRPLTSFIAIACAIVATFGFAPAAGAATATHVASGDASNHTCAVVTGGTVKCWGDNSNGQLGDGTNTSTSVPTTVTGICTATQVATGWGHSCALLSDGTIKCWGNNDSGQLGNGTVRSTNTPTAVSGITDATQIESGSDHMCALLSGGTVKCWGYNNRGQLGNLTLRDSKTPTDVALISRTTLTGATRIAVGSSHSCALLSDGTVKCWGLGSSGQLGDGQTVSFSAAIAVSGLTNAGDITAGSRHTCALLNDLTMKCWGDNTSGQLGDGSNTTSKTPKSVTGITSAIQVAAGIDHTCALLDGGTVKCWGRNLYGQVGDGSTTSPNTPTTVTDVANASQVTAGAVHSCALLGDGTVKCWGRNDKGQIGDESTTNRTSPVYVSGFGPVDSLPPSPPGVFTGVPSSPTNLASATIGFTLGESGGTVECRLDSGSWAACTSISGRSGSFALSGLADGFHSVSARQTDAAGNVSQVGTSDAWRVDRTPPTDPVVTRISPVSHLSSQSTASFSYSGEEDATLMCSLDGAPFEVCSSSPLRLSNGVADLEYVPDGLHSVAVKAIDAVGNESKVTTVTWDVDTVPHAVPVVDLSSPEVSPTTSTSATISYEGVAGATFLCSLDGAGYSACSGSPVQLTGLAEGSHTFRVKASDGAGNESDAGSVTWVVDTTAPAAPTLTRDAPASSPTRSTSVSISYSGETGAEFSCSLDGGAWRLCETSPEDLDGLAEGTHTLRVRATDAAGNTGDAASVTWRVDTTPPAAPSITGAPGATTTLTSVSLTLSSEAGATFECSLDGAEFKACASVVALTGLAPGAHTFTAQAKDVAGNTGAARGFIWTIYPPVGAPTVLAPASGTKTVYKKAGKWHVKVGLLFSTGGNPNPAAQLLTVQLAVDAHGKPVTVKPSNSEPAPTSASFANGVVAWDPAGEVSRQTVSQPVWVRVGNMAGKWSGWVRLTP